MATQNRPHYTSATSRDTQSSLRALIGWTLVIISMAVALAGAYMWGRSHGGSNAVEILLPTPGPVLVQVVGEVNRPGLLQLEEGDRMIDAIEAAGGLTEAAAPQDVNLAAFVRDGARIVVPSVRNIDAENYSGDIGRTSASEARSSAGDPQNDASSEYSSDGLQSAINVNTATKAELMSLPGIGDVRASRIIALRTELGGFLSEDQLMLVDGIGPQTLAAIRHLISVQ